MTKTPIARRLVKCQSIGDSIFIQSCISCCILASIYSLASVVEEVAFVGKIGCESI